MNNGSKSHVIIKLPEVVRRTALSKASIYVFIKEGRFPKPIPLGVRAVGFLESEINSWLSSQIEKREQNTEVV